MEHILDLENQKEALHAIFKKIQESNTILFLGAGASVGEKRYLSKEIIEYYEAYLGKNLNEPNITRFLDILSADESFSRAHFDNFVVKIIQKLQVTDGHRILASIPWREIITTNYDLLVETAYDELLASSQTVYEIKLVKSIRQYSYKESNTEVKYIKLNGCIQDIGLYPLAFSTDDFSRLKSFYKTVLNDLRNPSQDIMFLSIGYSYTDTFGKELLDKFDSYNYREKRWMINVDPYPNETALAFYKKNKVCIIKCSFQDFFLKYREWEQQHQNALVRKKGLSISNSQNHYISIPPRLLLNLEGMVKQLNTQTRDIFIKDSDFYKGEEPTFNIITRGVDVIKSNQIAKCKSSINQTLESSKSTLIPIFFITGDFGIGKSTFTLRLIYELENDTASDLIAFEILDFFRLRKEWLIELVNTCKAKHLVFFCDELEIESYFKSLLEIQRDLSIEQFNDCTVFFIVPIRENILEKYRLNRSIPQSHYLKVDGALELDEIEDLVEKLKNANLISFRDAAERKRLIKKIQNEYKSDSFISLLALVTSGKHENDLISSYNELSKEAKEAFLYTALLHKHKLVMPASWLKQNISMTWDEFTQKILKAEGKGLLIHDVRPSHGTQPDIYFRTKHPLIAEKLVNRFLPSKDKEFSFYEKMLRTIEPGQTNSYIANDLLKSFVKIGEYNDIQLNRLFDSGYTKLSDDPYFLLNYSINLQNRKTILDLKKALELLIYAESLLEYRNHRFIHRRGVISFELAKLYYEDDSQLSFTGFYLTEAKDLFKTKQLLDPFSAYSYVDYIKTLIWELDHIEGDEEDDIQKQIQIEGLFDLANRSVIDGIDRIDKIQSSYSSILKKITKDQDYKEYLDNLYESFRLKPYACILLFNYYQSTKEYEESDRLIEEMEYYQDNFEIVKFLFNYYGKFLFDPNIRIKLLKMSRDNPGLEKDDPLRFNYFNFVAETYNHHYYEGKTYLNSIQTRFNNLNPEFHYMWSEPSGDASVFEAVVIKNTGEKFKGIKIPSLQQTVRLVKGNYDHFTLGERVHVRLHFYLYGLMAQIVKDIEMIENPEA